MKVYFNCVAKGNEINFGYSCEDIYESWTIKISELDFVSVKNSMHAALYDSRGEFVTEEIMDGDECKFVGKTGNGYEFGFLVTKVLDGAIAVTVNIP